MVPSYKSSQSMSSIPLCSSAHTTPTSALPEATYIIDTGATDNMICNISYFTSVTSSVSYSVRMPNGILSPITHLGVMQIIESLILHDVLCVLSFTFNFISSRKLASQIHCCLVFLLVVCFIQGLSSWTMIGKGRVEQGLYHLQTSPYSPATLANVLSSFFDKNSLFRLLF